MKLGIMQPYFFPYSGYFALIAKTDRWVVFDVTQYTPRTWMNRNRILHPKEGWQYVNLPLKKAGQSIRILEAESVDVAKARDTILGQLVHYKKHAPFYEEVRKIVLDSMSGRHSFLTDVCVDGLVSVCNYLDIPFNYAVCSREKMPLDGVISPGGWALEISRFLGAQEYFNPIGGRELFDPVEFEKYGIRLNFVPPPEFKYSTGPFQFVEHLSILDVLMWNSPKAVKEMLISAPSFAAH